MYRIICFLLIILSSPGCGVKEREDALDKKETELLQKEQELILREKTLAIKEDDLLKREQKLDTALVDTAFIVDTTFISDAKLVGLWSAKMICTETTCAGSAVGDTKSETWDFSYQNSHLIVKAIADEKLVRIYTGGLTKNGIELTEDVGNRSTAPISKFLVRLNLVNESSMQGKREIIRNDDCKIVFDLQLTKQQ